jgi:ankyrin repeat protein
MIQVSKAGARSNTFNPTARALNQADKDGQTPLMLACLGEFVTGGQLVAEL